MWSQHNTSLNNVGSQSWMIGKTGIGLDISKKPKLHKPICTRK